MQCRRCGKETGNSMYCSFCGYRNTEGNVRKMTNTEKRFFDGITIDTGDAENPKTYKRRTNNKPSRRYSRRVYYTSTSLSNIPRFLGKLFTGLINSKLFAKIAVTLITIAFSIMVFAALPILFLILAVGIALLKTSKKGRW